MTKVIDSGSSINPKSTEKSPAGIHENRGSAIRCPWAGRESIVAITATPTAKAAHEAKVASR